MASKAPRTNRAEGLRPGKWCTADDRLFNIPDLPDDHLNRIIRFLESRGVQWAERVWMTNGEVRPATEEEWAMKAEADICGPSELTIKKYRELVLEKAHREGTISPYVLCSRCGFPCTASAVHRVGIVLQGEVLVGDECCWDERLRTTE